ncbi:MAG: glycoside hydrolase family 127 protein [Chitinophagaceae bacterium]|nr:glycoside hydrolase family 127 protein [Chitinophagaceae bacterium]
MPYKSGLKIIGSFVFFMITSNALCQNILDSFRFERQPALSVQVNQYDTRHFNYLTNRTNTAVSEAFQSFRSPSALWQVKTAIVPVENMKNALDIAVTFYCKEGSSPHSSVTVNLAFSNWSASNYVLFPGAVYNGNRFDWRRISYSPKLLDPRDIGPAKPQIISDVPKLNFQDGPSRIQERSGSMATPAAGFYDSSFGKVFWMLTEQGSAWGDHGIGIEETDDRKDAVISITAPVVREVYKYHLTDMRFPSDDKTVDFKQGDSAIIRLRIYEFNAERLQDLFNSFSIIRKDFIRDDTLATVLPFSAAFNVQEKKFNELNFVPEYGYYSVGARENFLQDWQIGWTGGMISTYPLLVNGTDTTKAHVIRNFDWLFPAGISPSGFFWDSGEGGNKWYGGDIRKPHTANWHLIRKSGDGLYYVIRQFMQLQQLNHPVKNTWKAGAKVVADAFVRLWKQHGQFGNFVDSRTGVVIVGGSTSGGIAPAALCLSYKYYGNKEYLDVAIQAANYYNEHFVKKGITCGGPGDAMQNPDSESCYGLLESYMQLYKTTGDRKWLYIAEDVAKQFATWVMCYNYRFPASSMFGKLKLRSTGAVIANTQNKHGAPGICTYSGLALLELYRATGNKFYSELLKDICHNIPQYLSHLQKPIPGLKPGWMSERVSTTDWLEGIGEMPLITTWSETALMLAYTEIPGLYVLPDKSYVVSFDNISTEVIADNNRELKLKITNKTKMDAAIKLLVETAAQMKQSPENIPVKYTVITILAGESRIMKFLK